MNSKAQRRLREVPQASIQEENASELVVFGKCSLSPGNSNLCWTSIGIKAERNDPTTPS